MNQFYYELIITPKNNLELFSSFLIEVTNSAIEERDGSLIVRSTDELSDIEWATQELAKRAQIGIKSTITKRENRDWINIYKESIEPVEVGSFYIRPSWRDKKEYSIDIVIDPALAFGSGHHESTYLVLLAIDKYVKKSTTLLDVGCGSGIVAIAAYKKGASVSICDTDETAIKSSIENFKLNNSKIESYWVGSADMSLQKYDIVVANIVADIIIVINQDLKNSLKIGGILILSGIIERYLDKVLIEFSDFEEIEREEKNGWYTVVLKRE